MLTREDLEMVEGVFDNRYRKVDDCNDIMSAADRRQDATEKTLTKGMTLLEVIIAILSAIAVPLVALCIKLLFHFA